MHESEEREHGAGKGEGCGFQHLALDHEHSDCGQHQAAKDRTAAQNRETFVEDSVRAKFVESDGGGVRAGGAERIVDLQLAPGRKMRDQREHDRGRMTPRRFLEGLRADQHADVEQDRRDRDDGNQRHHRSHDSEPCQQNITMPVAAE